MQVKIKKVHPDAKTPVYKTDGAACFDISVCESWYIPSSKFEKVGTGLCFEIPDGYVMRVYIRSGLAAKGMQLMNSVGIIDSDYRGELFLLLKTTQAMETCLEKGQRVAQAIIEPVNRVTFVESDSLSETARGEGGFGSTGNS